jgi:hypothetical protein
MTVVIERMKYDILKLKPARFKKERRECVLKVLVKQRAYVELISFKVFKVMVLTSKLKRQSRIFFFFWDA